MQITVDRPRNFQGALLAYRCGKVRLERLLYVCILFLHSGCDYERDAKSVLPMGEMQQWELDSVSLPVYASIKLEEKRRIIGGGPSSMHWAPDSSAVAWIEECDSGENLKCKDLLVVRWVDDGREERIGLQESNVLAFGWSKDAQRIVVELAIVSNPEIRKLSELVVGIEDVEVVDIDLPSVSSPRSPVYWNEDYDIAFVFEGRKIGLYERSTRRVVSRKRGNYFVNKMVCADDGLALAEVPMSPGLAGRFVYLKNPFESTVTTFNLIDSLVKPILLCSPSGAGSDVPFVAFATPKRDSSTIYSYSTERNVLTRYLELSAVFGTSQTIQGVSGSFEAGYIGFILHSEDPAICGTWIASISAGKLWRISAYPSNVISLSRDGKRVLYQDAAERVQISLLDALEKK